MAKSLMWHVPINKSGWPQQAGWLPLWGPKYFCSGVCPPPPSNELALLFIWDTSKASLPLGDHGEWLFCYHFFQWGWHLYLPWGKLLSELQCLSVSVAPFLRLREQQLFLSHWDPHCVSAPLIKPRILLLSYYSQQVKFLPWKISVAHQLWVGSTT